ncbi:MAG: SUMF1/EgtB/PvdO family nonheme iron enzyme [Ardenticatenales bacterium]|nr:SUMF1/EgtB/PvdO family nonheme iron enzyme [Ardenticatenales bacterium]
MADKARRLALLIGNNQFEDEKHFPPLRTPANDVADMAAMLARHGEFEILGTLVDADEPTIRRAIADLYGQAERGDLTLLYYSGHGQKGTDGSLYLAARDTDFRRLRATGVRESFIQETMADSRSRHHVVVLDCCFSGAFAQGAKRGAAEPLLLEKLRGEATAILASSGTIQYSFEEKGRNSLFTSALLQGMETGRADENEDGLITVDELFAYADRQVRDQRRDQTPMLAQQKREIERLVLVRNPLGKARAATLPVTMTPPPPAPAATQTKGVAPAVAPPPSALPGWLWGMGGVLVTLALVFFLLWVSERNRVGLPETPAATSPSVAQVTEPLATSPTAKATNTPRPEPSGTPSATATDTRTPTHTPSPTPEPRPTATSTPGIGSPQVSPVDGMRQWFIPAGNFLMGSTDADANAASDEKPQHEVYLDAFWMDETEVTNDQFAQFTAAASYETTAEQEGGGYIYTSSGWEYTEGADWQHPQGPGSSLDGLGDHPVVLVSWQDAAAYCEWAGRALPTEAQWEKAARGEDGRIYPWGDTFDGTRLNYCDSNCEFDWKDTSVDDGYARTAPVGSYDAGASPYQALDMAGNVWEWVADWYDSGYYQNAPARNPPGPASGSYKVLRGGAWNYTSINKTARTASRSELAPTVLDDSLGFRCTQEYLLP